MAIQIIHPDGRVERPELPGEPTLQHLQTWVGGFIEVPGGGFRTPNGAVHIVVNEEGKLDGLPVNRTATEFYWQVTRRDPRFGGQPVDDVLVGTVVVLTAPNLLT